MIEVLKVGLVLATIIVLYILFVSSDLRLLKIKVKQLDGETRTWKIREGDLCAFIISGRLRKEGDIYVEYED